MPQLNFDATQVAPSDGAMDAIPAGWYNALIDETEMKPTKAGDGSYLQIRFNVIDGQYANRKVFDRLNLHNQNQTAVDIAYADLSAICHATNVLNLQDSSQLHGIPLKIKVKQRAATDQYDASNEVSSYKNINADVGTPQGAPATQGAPQMPQGGPQQPAQQQAPQGAPQGQPWQQPAQQPWQQPQTPAAAQQPPAQQPAPQQQAPVQQPQQGNEGAQPWAQTAAQNPGGTVPPWQAGQQQQ